MSNQLILDRWKKLYDETALLIDSMTWVDDKRGHKHPLEMILWDLTKLIARLEQGLK